MPFLVTSQVPPDFLHSSSFNLGGLPCNPVHKCLTEVGESPQCSDASFVEKNNKPVGYDHYYRIIFSPIIKLLGLNPKHRPHDTRHTFATLLSNANANAVSIKELCGHASYNTTVKHYTHKNIDELRKAVNLI